MIIAGWLLAILGLAQVVYAGTLDVTQLEPGNPLLGVAPSIVANANLLAQRSMIHQAGCAAFLAGAVFLAVAYLKPPPETARDKAWTNFGAIAAGALGLAAAVGFGWFILNLDHRNAAEKVEDAARVKQARAEASARLFRQADRLADARGGPPAGTSPPQEPMD
jgi:hypothetical protein